MEKLNNEARMPDTVPMNEYIKLRQAYEHLTKEHENIRMVLMDRQNEVVMSRVNILLKIVEMKNDFSEEFVKECAKEVEDILTIPEHIKKRNKEVLYGPDEDLGLQKSESEDSEDSSAKNPED